MLGRDTDLWSKGASAEDSMKFQVVNQLSRDRYDASLYKEAARRVVFKNCMESCEQTDETIPNFNKKFYYAQDAARACLQSCYNTRINAHFGASTADKEDLHMNFDEMKSEFQNYQQWHPRTRHLADYQGGVEENNIKTVLDELRAKNDRNKYQFN